MSRKQRRNRRNKSGGGPNAGRHESRDNRDNAQDRSDAAVRHRSSTETKSALRTTEFIAYAGAVLAVIMTALAVDGDGRGGSDPFGAESALRYISYLTIGYAVARGLAKAGSHENRIPERADLGDDTDDVTGDFTDHDARDVADHSTNGTDGTDGTDGTNGTDNDEDPHEDHSVERGSDAEKVDAAAPSGRLRRMTTDDVDPRP